jgi:uncharacterized protein
VNKKIFLSALLVFILLSAAGTVFYLVNKINKKVCFGNNCFLVEVAKTQQELSRGLMFRGSLKEDAGMLFVFQEEGEYGFWMKNTLIPLDIIWINEKKEVVYISKNTLPCKEEICPSVGPGREAKYVLELNGGMAEKIGLTEGSLAEF